MKTYKELPRSFGMRLLSFTPKYEQQCLLTRTLLWGYSNDVHIYIRRGQHGLAVEFYIGPQDIAFVFPWAYITLSHFPLGLQEFLKKLLTK